MYVFIYLCILSPFIPDEVFALLIFYLKTPEAVFIKAFYIKTDLSLIFCLYKDPII